jgi:hypothetical protein
MTAACSGLVPASASAAATHSAFSNFATGYLHSERQARLNPRPPTVSILVMRVKPISAGDSAGAPRAAAGRRGRVPVGSAHYDGEHR